MEGDSGAVSADRPYRPHTGSRAGGPPAPYAQQAMSADRRHLLTVIRSPQPLKGSRGSDKWASHTV